MLGGGLCSETGKSKFVKRDILCPGLAPGTYQHVERNLKSRVNEGDNCGVTQKPDILLPGITPGSFQHKAPEPNTNKAVVSFNNKQRRHDEIVRQQQNNFRLRMKDTITNQYDKHAENKQIRRRIEDKVKEKMQQYEATVEKRREKLQQLLCDEERIYYFETVQMAQQGNELKLEDMKRRTELLKARREEERLKIVHEKRIEQYKNRCQELRPSLAKKHLIESKNTQLQQMRENEMRREAERELDRMWFELMKKEVQTKMDREQQELLRRKNQEKDLLETWNMQVKGKELMQADVKRVALEEKLEIEKLSEQIRNEQIEMLDARRRKRDQLARDILEQIAAHEAVERKRKQEEAALDQSYNSLTMREIQREKDMQEDTTKQAAREMVMYRNHLKDLKAEREKEDTELEKLLEIHRKEIEKKQDESRCKLVEARMALQKDVLQGRAEQLNYKQQEAEQQLKLKQAENELLRMCCDTNERLQAESDRLEMEAVRQYREDLQKQIEYNNKLREQARQEMERHLLKGLQEEEEYRRIADDMVKKNLETNATHPFRKMLEKYDCHC